MKRFFLFFYIFSCIFCLSGDLKGFDYFQIHYGRQKCKECKCAHCICDVAKKASSKDQQPKPVFVSKKDIAISLGGRVREDYFFFNKVSSFRGDLDDQFSYFRNKLELDVRMKQGVEKFGRPSSEAGLTLAHYGYWQRESNYVKNTKEKIYLEGLDGAQTGDKHNHQYTVPLVYLEQAWFDLHLGTIFERFRKNPVSFKMGLFPYWIGRGLSLGFHEDMALTYGGWEGENYFNRFPSMPPGILIHGQISNNLF